MYIYYCIICNAIVCHFDFRCSFYYRTHNTIILFLSLLHKEYAQCCLKLVWGVWMMWFLRKHRSLSSLLGKCSVFLPSWSCFPNLSGPTCLFGSILWLFGTICSKLVSLFLLLSCLKDKRNMLLCLFVMYNCYVYFAQLFKSLGLVS